MASFNVVDSLDITLTTTGSGVQPTDILKTYYIYPVDDTTEVEMSGTSFTASQYQLGRTFSIPSESIYVQDPDNPTTGEAKFIVRNTTIGSCLNTESARATLTGILLEETSGGGGGEPSCVLYSTFKTGSSAATACSAGTTTLYINGTYSTLSDIPSNPRIYTDAGCTSLASSTYVSDGTFARLWNGSDSLGDPELC